MKGTRPVIVKARDLSKRASSVISCGLVVLLGALISAPLTGGMSLFFLGPCFVALVVGLYLYANTPIADLALLSEEGGTLVLRSKANPIVSIGRPFTDPVAVPISSVLVIKVRKLHVYKVGWFVQILLIVRNERQQASTFEWSAKDEIQRFVADLQSTHPQVRIESNI